MSRIAIAITLTLLSGAAMATGQEPKNAPQWVKSVKVPGLELRYVDFKWDEAAFDALEKGGTHPAAGRSWVLARLTLPLDPLKWNGKAIPVGSSLLILNPARAGAGPTLEIRSVDMREVFTKMNVIAEPPEGITYGKAPAVFGKVGTVAPRLEVTVNEQERALDVGVHYGDRAASVRLDRY
jgi:hypothetical protein